MNNQYNINDLFDHGEGNKAMGGVIAINVNAKEVGDVCINSFMPLDMTKERARKEAMGFMKPGSDLTSSSDEEVAEYLINSLAYWYSIGNERLVKEHNKDSDSTGSSLMLCVALISTLTDADFWGVVADLESDGFMNRYTFKSLSKDEYIHCVKEYINCQSA